MELYIVHQTYGDQYDTYSSDTNYFVSKDLANAYAQKIQIDICHDYDLWVHPKLTVQIEQPSQGHPFGKWIESDEFDTSTATFTDEHGNEHTVSVEKINTKD